jgi:hypothetical protein
MKLLDDSSFIQEAAKWRCNWIMTPRRQKQDAILLLLKGRKPANSFQEIGTCLKDGRRHLDLQQQPRAEAEEQQPRVEAEAELSAQPKQSQKSQKSQQYSFLGRNKLCSRAWRHYTGVSAGALHWAADTVQRGVQNFARKAPTRLARRRDEMVHAVWVVGQDLHHQSPYTNRSQPDSWHITFHHKICLWRLVKKMHESRKDDPAKPRLFQQEPTLSMFKRVIVLPEFKKLVFHRIVDIGRCPKCQYFEWKCASMPLELRGVWQDALAQHHAIQIEQKRCYAADRARAASLYPAIELYMAMTW